MWPVLYILFARTTTYPVRKDNCLTDLTLSHRATELGVDVVKSEIFSLMRLNLNVWSCLERQLTTDFVFAS